MKKIFLSAAALTFAAACCFNGNIRKPLSVEDLNQNYTGEFSGLLPCADCAGITTSLTLDAGGNAVASEVYQGKGDYAITSQCKWAASADLSYIKISCGHAANYYRFINKDYIERLDIKARPIKSQHDYKLRRVK
jgi:copper homeostasis protein (lipoprotein)